MTKGEEAEGEPPRKRSRVSRACTSCRRKKSKCDGGDPVCGLCVIAGCDCSYDREDDKRKPPNRAFVAALQERVSTLEEINRGLMERLAAVGIGVSPSGTSPHVNGNGLVLLDRARAHGKGSPAPFESTERLQVDEVTGQLISYGPTSSMHQDPTEAKIETPSPAAAPSASQPQRQPWSSISTHNWNANLPLGVLLTRDQHDALLEAYMSFLTAPRDHDLYAFFNDMEQPRADHASSNYSPMLHCAMLALACALPVAETLQVHESTQGLLIAKAKELLDQEIVSPTLATVLGVALLSPILPEQNLTFIYVGVGYRISHILGLNLDCSRQVASGLIEPWMKARRDATFWSQYIGDKLMSSVVGRTMAMPERDHEVTLPVINDEVDSREWSMPSAWTPPDGSNDPLDRRRHYRVAGYTSTAFSFACQLAILHEAVLDAVYSLKADLWELSRSSSVSDISVRLETWYQALPTTICIPSFQPSNSPALPHVIFLHMHYHFVCILLHRPFYKERTSEYSVVRCDNAAKLIGQLISLFNKVYGLAYAPLPFDQIMFGAGTIHLMRAVHHRSTSPKKSETALADVDAAISGLLEHGKTWPCSRRSANILGRRRLKAFPTPYPPDSGSAIHPVADDLAPLMPLVVDTSVMPTLDGHEDFMQYLDQLAGTLPEHDFAAQSWWTGLDTDWDLSGFQS